VIPVKNGDYWLEATLTSLLNQKLNGRFEIIIIDSGSTDKSLEIIQRFPVRLIKIDPSSFNHGTTRNLGVQAANGEFIVMTVQDARPVDDNWLMHLLQGFDEETVAGVCGQQIVAHDLDKNPVEWFRPISADTIKKYYFPRFNEFENLSPNEKRNICGWDNVTSMYRKKVLLDIPFDNVLFAEDALWAKNALKNGHKIVYNTAAKVYHYHLEEPQFTIRRAFTVYFHFYKYFGYKPSYIDNGIMRKLRDVKLLLTERKLTLSDKLKWYKYNHVVRKKLNEATTIFLNSLSQSEDSLIQVHNQLCAEIPQAKRPSDL
jgi:rhamnosyltransferase